MPAAVRLLLALPVLLIPLVVLAGCRAAPPRATTPPPPARSTTASLTTTPSPPGPAATGPAPGNSPSPAPAPPAPAPSPARPSPARPSPASSGGTVPASSASPAAPLSQTVIGTSVRGRTIVATEAGTTGASRTLLVVGCIHGNEPAGIAIAQRLEALAPPAGTDVWVIEDLNPDGVAAGTRQNADGVDLNRNFPYQWANLGAPGSQQYAGTGPLSEPESAAAARLIERIHPSVSIWFHQPEDLVDLSGGDPSVERRYAALVGLPAQQLTRYNGSAVSWENQLLPGTTSFVVELPPGVPRRGRRRPLRPGRPVVAGVRSFRRGQADQASVTSPTGITSPVSSTRPPRSSRSTA